MRQKQPCLITAATASLCLLLFLLACDSVGSFPWLSTERTTRCGTCHVNPTGGGQRTEYGNREIAYKYLRLPYTRNLISANGGSSRITDHLSVGFDSRHKIDDNGTIHREQADAYLTLVPFDRLRYHLTFGEDGVGEQYGLLFIDEDRRAFARLGRFYPTFGLRTETYEGFHRSATGHPRGLQLDGVAVGYSDNAITAVAEAFNSNQQDVFGLHLALQTKLGRFGLLGGASWRLSKKLGETYGDFPHAKAFFGALSWNRLNLLGELDLIGRSNDSLAVFSSLRGRIVEGAWLALDYNFIDPNRQVTSGVEEDVALGLQVYPIPFVELKSIYRYHTQGSLQDEDELELQVHFGY